MTVLLIILSLSSVLQAQDIVYEAEDDTCKLPDGRNGICKPSTLCPGAFERFPSVQPVTCGFSGKIPNICCSVKLDRVTESPVSVKDLLDISPPNVDFYCGESGLNPSVISSNSRASRVDVLIPKKNKDNPAVPLSPLESLKLDNAAFQKIAAIGGVAAGSNLVKYAAIIGQRTQFGENDWFCTGILLNQLWVLTAAHCLFQRQVNIVRLGEYDFANDFDDAQPVDFEVTQRILHPEYSPSQGYHDLALLELSRRVTFGRYINPVCLPWGTEIHRDLINQRISLTGWGATQFDGVLSSVPQEVNVTIFPSSVCDQSYSELRSYNLEFPRGITDNILCAGDPQGGKDACQGDSGGPVVYLNDNGQYVLAGVVSKGYGCGLKDFPGLYANIQHIPYLAWIKQVAF